MSRAAIFLDKDGTLVRDVPYNVDPAKVTLYADAVEALRLLQAAGYRLVIVSNQPGIALGYFDEDALAQLRLHLIERFALEGVHLAGIYFCPHGRDAGCACRKPEPGLLLRAAIELDLELARSWMLGDILDDVEAGSRAGCRSVLVDTGGETLWIDGPGRQPQARVATLMEAARHVVGARHVARAS